MALLKGLQSHKLLGLVYQGVDVLGNQKVGVTRVFGQGGKVLENIFL